MSTKTAETKYIMAPDSGIYIKGMYTLVLKM